MLISSKDCINFTKRTYQFHLKNASISTKEYIKIN